MLHSVVLRVHSGVRAALRHYYTVMLGMTRQPSGDDSETSPSDIFVYRELDGSVRSAGVRFVYAAEPAIEREGLSGEVLSGEVFVSVLRRGGAFSRNGTTRHGFSIPASSDFNDIGYTTTERLN